MKLLRRLSLVLAILSAIGIACSSGSTSAPKGAAGDAPPGGKITVFAAASLNDAFREIGKAFTARNSTVSIDFNFAGSPTLRTQLEQGARADIYASADQAQMDLAVRSGVVADGGQIFARNSLVIITPADNHPKVATAVDLANPGLKLVLANKDVPVGAYARQVLGAMEAGPPFGSGFSARVLRNLVSEESDVKQVVAKVQLGEADAGIVYRTDVTASVAPKLTTISVPAGFNVVAAYPLSVVKGAPNERTARAFVAFVLSDEGQAILRKYGFETGGSS